MTLKPIITKQKRLGRITGYCAILGEITGEGRTAAEATALCERRVTEALERLAQGTAIATFRGHTYLVQPALYGWSYWLDTFSSGYMGHGAGGTTRREAMAYALHHLCQSVWTPETDDAAFLAEIPDDRVRAEIAGWLRFQRAYAWLRAGGVPDVQCHEAACRLASAA
jgi:hypothetical protein